MYLVRVGAENIQPTPCLRSGLESDYSSVGQSAYQDQGLPLFDTKQNSMSLSEGDPRSTLRREQNRKSCQQDLWNRFVCFAKRIVVTELRLFATPIKVRPDCLLHFRLNINGHSAGSSSIASVDAVLSLDRAGVQDVTRLHHIESYHNKSQG